MRYRVLWCRFERVASGRVSSFWASVDDQAALMIGQDDETWDVSVTLPFDLVDEIVREVAQT
jgi:hypothetical protein